MSASTANIAKKKATTLPTTLDDTSFSDVVLQQVFEKGHQFDDEDLRCFERTSWRHNKRTEQMQLGRNTTTYYVGLCSLPESADVEDSY
jgi:hypothetical protein